MPDLALPQAHGPVIRRSEDLRRRLSEEGLDADGLLFESAALIRDIRDAALRTDAHLVVLRVGEKVGARNELRVHLAYWRAIRRILTGSWDPDEPLPKPLRDGVGAEVPRGDSVSGFDFLAEASRADGVSGRLIRDFEIRECKVDRFGAVGCRLIDGLFEDLDIEYLELRDTSLINVNLRGIKTSVLQGDSVAFLGGDLLVSVRPGGNVSLADAAFNDCRISVDGADGDAVQGKVVFRYANLASGAPAKNSVLGRLAKEAGVASGKLSASTVTLEACKAAQADFDLAWLIGSQVVGCTLPSATFRETKATGAVFVATTLRDATFERAELQKARFTEGTDVAGAVFRDCDLTAADFTGAVGVKKATFERCTLENVVGR